MSHPAKIPPAFQPFSQPKTLFLPAPGRAGVLMQRAGSRYRSRAVKFSGPEAALAWCLKNQAGLVFFYPPESLPPSN